MADPVLLGPPGAGPARPGAGPGAAGGPASSPGATPPGETASSGTGPGQGGINSRTRVLPAASGPWPQWRVRLLGFPPPLPPASCLRGPGNLPAPGRAPRGCASRKLPLPARPSSPPRPRPGAERRVIGPAAPSVSGRVTALVSNRPETGSALLVLAGRGGGVSRCPVKLRLARGSAR